MLLHDADAAAIDRGLGQLRAGLDRLVERGRIEPQEREARLARIAPAPDLAMLAPAALVIEAIVEDLDVKASLLGKVEALLGPDAIVATNTSSLSVTALAARLQRPERVVGMHFFNPAPQLPLVEVVSGHLTSAETAGTIAATALAGARSPSIAARRRASSSTVWQGPSTARPFAFSRRVSRRQPPSTPSSARPAGSVWARSRSWT